MPPVPNNSKVPSVGVSLPLDEMAFFATAPGALLTIGCVGPLVALLVRPAFRPKRELTTRLLSSCVRISKRTATTVVVQTVFVFGFLFRVVPPKSTVTFCPFVIVSRVFVGFGVRLLPGFSVSSCSPSINYPVLFQPPS